MYLIFISSPKPSNPLGGWQPQAEVLSAQIQTLIVGSSMDILLPLCPPFGRSICPSICVGPQWPPSAARNFSSSYCRAVSCLLSNRALTRSGCCLPSASPAASFGGWVSAYQTVFHHNRVCLICHIHGHQAIPYPTTSYHATSCNAKPGLYRSSPIISH